MAAEANRGVAHLDGLDRLAKDWVQFVLEVASVVGVAPAFIITKSRNNAIDCLSNGFKIRNTGGNVNGSGDTYIYAAFAENPFQYARAR